jgi:hypothetical protein
VRAVCVCIERAWGDGVGVGAWWQLRYFVDRLCDDLAYLRNRLHNVDDVVSEESDHSAVVSRAAVHNG